MMKRIFVLLVSFLFVLSALNSISFAGLNDGLVAYYPFNGNANDESGNGNDGTVVGATLTEDRFGNVDSAYYFDAEAVNDHFIDLHPGKIAGNTFTVGAWFNSSNATSINQQWIVNWRPNGSDKSAFRLMLENNRITSYLIDRNSSRGNTYKHYQGATSLKSNTWYYATITWDGFNLKLYLNGKEDASYSVLMDSTVVIDDLVTNRMIGNTTSVIEIPFYNSRGTFFGSLDDIRLYSRALSEAEIQQLVCEGKDSLECGLVAYYPFNGNAKDESGNGNDGVVYGATLTDDRFGESNSAYYFDGLNPDRIVIANKPILNPQKYTISSWIKFRDSSITSAMLLNNLGVPGDGWQIFARFPTQKIGFRVHKTASQYSEIELPVNSFLENWMLVTASYDGSQLRLYVDGNLLASKQNVIGYTLSTSKDLNIGVTERGIVNPNHYTHMSVDDFRLYNRVLSESEIQALYSQEPNDTDYDDISDDEDNCPDFYNPEQEDNDKDGSGDVCDDDDDNDTILDEEDNCPLVTNFDQTDTDSDTFGDACDVDDDNDYVDDTDDNCPLVFNTEQENFDGDSLGDACDADDDNDGINDDNDTCPFENPEGSDANLDGCIDRVEDLPGIIIDLPLPDGTKNSLLKQTKNLKAFINHVEAQRGKKLSGSDADMLIEFANNILSQQ